jgi:hypothetical protein
LQNFLQKFSDFTHFRVKYPPDTPIWHTGFVSWLILETGLSAAKFFICCVMDGYEIFVGSISGMFSG